MMKLTPMPTTLVLRISFVCNLLSTFLNYLLPSKFITSIFLLPYTWFRPPLRRFEKLSIMSSSPSASGVDPSELKRVFQMFDRNGDGQITKKELSDSFKNLGIYIPEGELIGMVDKIDVNGDGYVDIEEFGTLYQSIMDERDEDEDMREAFNVFDQNGDGFITVEELQSVLDSLGLKQGRTVEDCKMMINKVDIDGDGMVNFKEFKQMMRGGGFAILG